MGVWYPATEFDRSYPWLLAVSKFSRWRPTECPGHVHDQGHESDDLGV